MQFEQDFVDLFVKIPINLRYLRPKNLEKNAIL